VGQAWASCNIRPGLDLARHTAVGRIVADRMAAGHTAGGCKPQVLEQAMQFRSMGLCLRVFSFEQ